MARTAHTIARDAAILYDLINDYLDLSTSIGANDPAADRRPFALATIAGLAAADCLRLALIEAGIDSAIAACRPLSPGDARGRNTVDYYFNDAEGLVRIRPGNPSPAPALQDGGTRLRSAVPVQIHGDEIRRRWQDARNAAALYDRWEVLDGVFNDVSASLPLDVTARLDSAADPFRADLQEYLFRLLRSAKIVNTRSAEDAKIEWFAGADGRLVPVGSPPRPWRRQDPTDKPEGGGS